MDEVEKQICEKVLELKELCILLTNSVDVVDQALLEKLLEQEQDHYLCKKDTSIEQFHLWVQENLFHIPP